eukprot:UN23589
MCPPFQTALKSFEEEKIKCSNLKRLKETLQAMIKNIPPYVSMLGPQDAAYKQHYLKQAQVLQNELSKEDFEKTFSPSSLWNLKPTMLDTMGNFFGNSGGLPLRHILKGMQKVPSNDMFSDNLNVVDSYLNIFSENLLGSAILLDGLFGYQLGVDLKKDSHLLQSILGVGCGYVTEQKRVHIVFDARRASLHLTDDCVTKNKKLKSRVRDVKRVLRNFDKPLGEFSMRVNTDFDGFIKGLRA